jgi:hypothetical protein
MSAPKTNPLPISFDDFKKNPVAGVAFCMLLAVSYLYYDVKTGYGDQIEKSNQKIDKMGYALKKSDSALSAAITELRIINTVKKL